MTDEDEQQLELLNEAVESAIEARTAWLDERMPKYAKFAIGEDLYNLETGELLGTVKGYYRYWAEHDVMHDTSMDIDYEIHVGGCVYDNTSRYAGSISIGRKTDQENN
ncbi:MAG: hypothetical protein RL156_1744 [Bacteroidota bacterium]|jgi:hypothetical protein